MKQFFNILILVIGILPAHAQQVVRCYTTEMQEQLRQQGQWPESDVQFERWIAERIALMQVQGGVESEYVLPVVVHIIYQNENNPWNISNAQVLSQMQVLNEDFLRTNPDTVNTPPAFLPAAVNTSISFCLAQRDPQGNPTTGIIRHAFPNTTAWSTNAFNSTVKPATIWDPTRYLNVWIANLSGGVLGYAQFPTGSGLPGLSGGTNANTDGIVLLYTSVGRPPFNPFPGVYNRGRTATHEVGHYLGLRHIWGDGGCSVDDFCADTPPSDAANFGCPVTHVSCGNVDMVQNYMDYTDDACMNIFTADQRTRMIAVMQNSPRRLTLPTSLSCLPPVQRPMAGFLQTADTICTGGLVSFTDLSTNQPSAWLWTFVGGTPATATTANPSNIRYDSSGVFKVTLITTNTAGSDTLERQFAVVVQPALNAVLDSLAPICVNQAPRILTSGLPRGGVYSGPGVVSDSVFNPAAAGVGTHAIIYTLPGCGSSDTASITVFQAPAPDLQLATQSFCVNDSAVLLQATPPGGVLSGAGVSGNTFSPAQAGAGTHALVYSLSNAVGCVSTDTIVVVVNALPQVNLPILVPVCVATPFVVLPPATPAGGSWAGPGVSNDTLYPALAGSGLVSLTYTTPAAAQTGCVNRAIATINISPVPVLSFTPVAPLCVRGNNLLLNQANIGGGNYSGPGVTFGIFSPAQAGVGTHTIQFTGNSGGCSVAGSYTVQVFAAPAAEIENGMNDSLRSRNMADSYRWYLDGQLLVNETSRSLRPQTSGVYSLELEENSCASFRSSDFAYFMTSVQEGSTTTFSVYPNPSSGLYVFETRQAVDRMYDLQITDLQGRVLQQVSSSAAQFEIDLRGVSAGVYLLRYSSGANVSWMRLVKH
ncbi:MAG: M43 family zinc metalloprotease [Sphingobacteriaceae bacterium]|nr:M43 family zinc metalloprotease [Sphingobacteriaceae bacterium]